MLPDDETPEVEEDEGEDYFYAPPDPVILSDGDSTLVIPDVHGLADSLKMRVFQYWEGKFFGLSVESGQFVEIGAIPAKQKPKLVQ